MMQQGLVSGDVRARAALFGEGTRCHALRRRDLLSPTLLGLIAWGAFAFGGVYPWAFLPLMIGAVAYGAASLMTPGVWRPGRLLLGSVGALVAAVSLQVVPLPAVVADRVSPAARRYLARADLEDPRSQSVLLEGRSSARALSVRPRATLVALGALCALVLLLIGCTHQFAVVGAVTVARGIVLIGLILALAAIIQRAASPLEIYGWWAPLYAAARPIGPFVDRNNFAGWMLMALPVALGCWRALLTGKSRRRRRDWRARLAWIASPEAGQWLAVSVAIAAMGLALVMTLSRSGMIGLGGGLSIAVWMLLRGRYAARSVAGRVATAFFVVAIIGGALVWTGLDSIGTRFAASAVDLDRRVRIWKDALTTARDFPLAGTGLNTYQWVGYVHSNGELFVEETHNDYLQLLAEGGVLLGIPILIVGFAVSREIRRRFLERRDDPGTYWMRVGAVTGMVSIGVQELAEFSLQMPGNAVLFTVLVAIAMAPSPKGGGYLPEPSVVLGKNTNREAVLLAGGVLVAAAAGLLAYSAHGPYGAVARADPRARWLDEPASGQRLLAFDASGDGTADHWAYLEGETLVRLDRDRDRDGRIDVREFYAGDLLTRRDIDSDGDGRLDRRVWHQPDGRARLVETIP
jgi:hypothetical protein